MSATSGNSVDSKPFTLQFDNAGTLTGEDAKDATIVERFGASKTLSLVESEKPVEAIATEADKLAKDKPGLWIVIFVKTPEMVKKVRDALQKKNKAYTTRIAQLTGTMRGLERDELVDTEKPLGENDHERRVMQRFLKPVNDPSQEACFLISTSAGEVGFDLNADHLVCDATTIDSLIQRLGRVNRRGGKDRHATVILVREPAKKKDGKPVELEGLDRAIANTLELLKGVTDFSPKNIAAMKSGDWKDKYKDACTPEPAPVELTDILLDAWSMTSITEPMPGRPAVDPWLRGIAEWEPPRTEVAWRAELDLEGFADLEPADIEEWFDTHRVLTHETLSDKTSEVASWFKKRREEISDADWARLAERSVIIDRAGLDVLSLGEVINRLSRSGNDADGFLRGAEIVVPSSFGGIRRGVGLLDSTEPKLDKNEEERSPDDRKAILKDRQNAIDVADVRGRYREVVVRPEDGTPESTPLDPNSVRPELHARFAVQLQSDDDKTVRLISYVPKIDRPDMGRVPQTLEGHIVDVCKAAGDILDALQLKQDDPIRVAAELASWWHDHGKNRELFQFVVDGTASDSARPWPDHVRGKSGGKDRGKPRRAYRHEFGSLRDFADAFNSAMLGSV